MFPIRRPCGTLEVPHPANGVLLDNIRTLRDAHYDRLVAARAVAKMCHMATPSIIIAPRRRIPVSVSICVAGIPTLRWALPPSGPGASPHSLVLTVSKIRPSLGARSARLLVC